tara:strand:+ start:239 stop:895 length:657 start_codon:yes stop_codon:yes gene_type:complete
MKNLFINILLMSSLLLFLGCPPEIVSGCMDPAACNYNADATDEDGSCNLPDGCTDVVACNYDATALCDNGSCLYEADALQNPIDITFIEEHVSGQTGEDVIAHIHVRNSSCDEMTGLVVRKFFTCDEMILNDNGTPDDDTDDFEEPAASAYFCFNDICFTSSTIVSPNPLNLGPFEVDDYFKGYLTADVPGVYEVTYRFYLQDDPSQFTEANITYTIN